MRTYKVVLIVLALAAIVQSQQVSQLDLCIADTVAFAKDVRDLITEKQWTNISKASLLLAKLSALVSDCKPLFRPANSSSGLAGNKQCGDAMVYCFTEMGKKSDFKFPPGTRTINLRAMVDFWKQLGIDVSAVLEHCQYALSKRI